MDRSSVGQAGSSIALVILAVLVAGCSASGDEDSKQRPNFGNGGKPGSTGGSGSVSQPPLGGGNGPVLGEVPMPSEEKCASVIELTLRDFEDTHPDFESYSGLNDIGCGIVAAELGPDTKPVFASVIGTQKRVTTGDFEHLTFDSCAEWNGWMPDKVITDQASFDQWYRDVEGVNQTFTVPVELTDAGGGNFVYDSNAFFPLDGMGFGNTPNQQHNFHFTTEAHVRFTYVAGQKFTFRGDDDLWIFVNGKLALDLGGMHLPIAATIDFDAQAAALGIVPGGAYQMDIFHAERHTNQSNFRIETNIRCFEPIVVK